MYAITNQPLTVYPGKILSSIVTRNDMLPKSNGDTSNPPFSWPKSSGSLFSYEPYLSLLDPRFHNLDKAVNNNNLRPIDNGYMCPDSDIDKKIYLIVHKSGNNTAPRDRLGHWAVRWTVFKRGNQPTQALRNIEILSGKSIGPTGEQYLINYGPWTSAERVTSHLGMLAIPIGTLTLAQRHVLEAVAWNVGIENPNGDFNCQNWLAAVLSIAVAKGLFREDIICAAINKGLSDHIDFLEGVCILSPLTFSTLLTPFFAEFVHQVPIGF